MSDEQAKPEATDIDKVVEASEALVDALAAPVLDEVVDAPPVEQPLAPEVATAENLAATVESLGFGTIPSADDLTLGVDPGVEAPIEIPVAERPLMPEDRLEADHADAMAYAAAQQALIAATPPDEPVVAPAAAQEPAQEPAPTPVDPEPQPAPAEPVAADLEPVAAAPEAPAADPAVLMAEIEEVFVAVEPAAPAEVAEPAPVVPETVAQPEPVSQAPAAPEPAPQADPPASSAPEPEPAPEPEQPAAAPAADPVLPVAMPDAEPVAAAPEPERGPVEVVLPTLLKIEVPVLPAPPVVAPVPAGVPRIDLAEGSTIAAAANALRAEIARMQNLMQAADALDALARAHSIVAERMDVLEGLNERIADAQGKVDTAHAYVLNSRTQAQIIVNEASNAAAKLMLDAQAEVSRARSALQDEGLQILSEARTSAEKMLDSARAQRSDILRQMSEEKLTLAALRDEIEEARAAKERAEREVNDMREKMRAALGA